MSEIVPPDVFHLSAAIGWLELGNLDEAKAELEKISPQLREHPDVLEAKWLIFAQEKNWVAAAEIAEKTKAVAPNDPAGWLHYAYAIRRAPGGGLTQAWDALFPAFEKFPSTAEIPYNLSCYACQLGKFGEAMEWLQKALKLGGEVIKDMALRDPDLEPLQKLIEQL